MTNDNAPPRLLRADSAPPEPYEAFGMGMNYVLGQLATTEPGWVQMLIDTACTTTDPKEKQAAGFFALLLVDLNKEVIEAHMAAHYASGLRPIIGGRPARRRHIGRKT